MAAGDTFAFFKTPTEYPPLHYLAAPPRPRKPEHRTP
jgi:hypothetical protein